MKKTILLLAAVVSMANSARATHIIGGSMFHKSLGNQLYEIDLIIYRDCWNGQPYFDNPAYISIVDEANNVIQNLDIAFNTVNDDTLDLANSPICFPAPFAVCVHRAHYKFNVQLPDDQQEYRIMYQRCCRNKLVMNINAPLDQGITIMTNVRPSDANSSAVLNYPLPYYAFVQAPFIYDASATDPDGDSLAYRFSFPVSGAEPDLSGGTLGPQPMIVDLSTIKLLGYEPAPFDIDHILGDSQYPLTIDPKTGILESLPMMIGYFVIAFEIDEFRNGVKINSNHHEIAVIILDAKYGLGLSGNVWVTDPNSSTVPMDEADVHLIQRNPLNDSLKIILQQPIDSTGGYLYDNVFSSKYYVRALPAIGSAYAGLAFPTYHPDKFFWYNATEVEVCNFSPTGIDVFLRADSSEFVNGPAELSGKIVDQTNGLGMPNFEVWLMSDEAEPLPVQLTKTDAGGFFSFKRLSVGDYLLFANELNSLIINAFPPKISLDNGDHRAVYATIERQADRLEISSLISQKPGENILRSIAPNPATDLIRFDVPIGSELISVKIFNSAGALVQSETANHFSVANLPQGIYILETKTSGGRLVGKFVKI